METSQQDTPWADPAYRNVLAYLIDRNTKTQSAGEDEMLLLLKLMLKMKLSRLSYWEMFRRLTMSVDTRIFRYEAEKNMDFHDAFENINQHQKQMWLLKHYT